MGSGGGGHAADGLSEKAVATTPQTLARCRRARRVARGRRGWRTGVWPSGLVGLVGWTVVLLGLSNGLGSIGVTRLGFILGPYFVVGPRANARTIHTCSSCSVLGSVQVKLYQL